VEAVTDDFGSQFFMLGLAQSMDRREEKALNPCHILVQAIPKRQLSSKEEGLGRILDQLIFRYRRVFSYY
jgi:hypothetical protein